MKILELRIILTEKKNPKVFHSRFKLKENRINDMKDTRDYKICRGKKERKK